MLSLIKLTVEIDIKNHSQIITSHKGALTGEIASMFGNSKNLVEQEVKRQVKAALMKGLNEELEKNGVKAGVSIY